MYSTLKRTKANFYNLLQALQTQHWNDSNARITYKILDAGAYVYVSFNYALLKQELKDIITLSDKYKCIPFVATNQIQFYFMS